MNNNLLFVGTEQHGTTVKENSEYFQQKYNFEVGI